MYNAKAKIANLLLLRRLNFLFHWPDTRNKINITRAVILVPAVEIGIINASIIAIHLFIISSLAKLNFLLVFMLLDIVLDIFVIIIS